MVIGLAGGAGRHFTDFADVYYWNKKTVYQEDSPYEMAFGVIMFGIPSLLGVAATWKLYI